MVQVGDYFCIEIMVPSTEPELEEMALFTASESQEMGRDLGKTHSSFSSFANLVSQHVKHKQMK